MAKLRLDHQHMLNKFEQTLIDSCTKRFGLDVEPHASLMAAIMVSSIKDGDKKYIYNGGLQVACKVLQLNYRKIKFLFKDMHRIIKNKIEWRDEGC